MAHVQINSIEYGASFSYGGRASHVDISYTGIYIKPTKYFAGGKFELIDTKLKIEEFDKIVFYPKNSTYEKGIQADIEIKNKMRITGTVPNLPKGEYFISLRSAIDESSKLEGKDLSFTIL